MLSKLLYRNGFLVEVYKHLIYRFYLAGQFVPENFGKLWKHSLGFVVICIGTCMSVAQKMLCLNLRKPSQMVSDSSENITVKIKFIHCKHMKAEQ